MAPSAPVNGRSRPLLGIAMALIIVIAAGAFFSFRIRPAGQSATQIAATSEAKAYLRNLALSDVRMEASENFMNQQVVEVQGNIANNGSRKLASVAVYCLFHGLNGAEIHRERLFIVRTGNSLAPMAPGETRSFRLPFDELPPDWNQAMPSLVIAQITFAP